MFPGTKPALQLLLLAVVLVWNGQLSTSLCATGCQYATAILCSHSLTETVLVLSLSVRGLECSFHRLIYFILFIFAFWLFAFQLAKLLFFFILAKFWQSIFTHFYIIPLCGVVVCRVAMSVCCLRCVLLCSLPYILNFFTYNLRRINIKLYLWAVWLEKA